jgi:hypothetical protein
MMGLRFRNEILILLVQYAPFGFSAKTFTRVEIERAAIEYVNTESVPQ